MFSILLDIILQTLGLQLNFSVCISLSEDLLGFTAASGPVDKFVHVDHLFLTHSLIVRQQIKHLGLRGSVLHHTLQEVSVHPATSYNDTASNY